MSIVILNECEFKIGQYTCAICGNMVSAGYRILLNDRRLLICGNCYEALVHAERGSANG